MIYIGLYGRLWLVYVLLLTNSMLLENEHEVIPDSSKF
jgi:hypothetical protein